MLFRSVRLLINDTDFLGLDGSFGRFVWVVDDDVGDEGEDEDADSLRWVSAIQGDEVGRELTACLAAITSGTVLMPTTSAPAARRNRCSARVSYVGPATFESCQLRERRREKGRTQA